MAINTVLYCQYFFVSNYCQNTAFLDYKRHNEKQEVRKLFLTPC